jgi:hypothetical protein
MIYAKRCRTVSLMAGVLCFLSTHVSAQEMAQTVSLVNGWNAVHLKVSPGGAADEIFNCWPVASVGIYDAASFSRTRQFDAADSTEGLRSPSVRMWHRQFPGDSEVFALPANAILLCFATNAYSTTLYGAPEALRISWHPTGPGAVYNYIGLSIAPGTAPSLAAYCSGLKLSVLEANVIYGHNPQSAAFGPIDLTMPVADGLALAMTSETVGDWSGVFHVSPQHGAAFGSGETLQPLAIRNDADTARTARLSYLFGEAPNALDIPPRCEVLYRDVSGTAPVAAWQMLPGQLEKRLEPGEIWKLTLALDRSQFAATAAGTRYGGLLRVEDADGGSCFRTTIPLGALSDGGAAGERAWPAGLWVADVRLDKVTQVVNDSKLVQGIPAGGNMKLRLPMHVNRAGALKLLQRVVAAGTQAGDGTVATALYAGNAPIPAGASQSLRISAVCLPVDRPVTDGAGTFGGEAVFAFAVGADSAANPLRHALHPHHDGLRPDFQTPAPSGDDFENYVSRIKPELFSVSNVVSFVWDALPAGAAAWNPEETLHGRLTWDFGGLRREGTLRAQGRFTMRRVSPISTVEGTHP